MERKKRSVTTNWDAEEVRQKISTTRNRRKKQSFGSRVFIYFCAVFIISALLAGIAWLLVNDVCSLNKDYVETEEFVVSEDDSFSDVVKHLKEEGYINYKWLFKLYGNITGQKEWIDPGTYSLNSNKDYRELLNSLHDYEQDALDAAGIVKITIPEGYTVSQIIDLLVENGISTKEELEDAAANFDYGYEFINTDLNGQVNRLEGYLFPDTYEFDPDRTAVYDLDTMLTNFMNKFDGTVMTEVENSGYTWSQIVTIASIIEKEGIDDATERANIASVLYNRMNTLDSNTYGYLQLDTTIYYAMSITGTTQFSTDMDSPYNTYKYPGLPEGPICNPGMSAIEAALNPSDTNYYYFAAGKDGVNHFFATFAEHDAFVHSDMYQPD